MTAKHRARLGTLVALPISLTAATPFGDNIIVRAFGHGNVGFLLMVLGFMVIEMFTLMGIAFLSPKKDDDFGWRQLIEFWVKRAFLLLLPLVGAAVDWAWYWMSDPGTILATGEMKRFATKAICIGLLGYQLKQVVQNIARVNKNIPGVVWIIRLIDRMQAAALAEERDGEDQPQVKLDRRWYDQATAGVQGPYAHLLEDTPPPPPSEGRSTSKKKEGGNE